VSDLEIKKRTALILSELNKGLFEREEAMNLAFLSAIAGESIFLLGPPGVAKSLIARRLKFAFRDSRAFEYLMNRFSTPDEIFGPVSIKKLKDDDKYERLTEKYLPGSNVVFLDEIWKAGPSIQNALLTILNEKVYRNGEQEVKVKLRGIVSASNELPAEGQGLDALWDRFLFRVYVTGIQDRENFAKMITSCSDLYYDNIPSEEKISEEELLEWSKLIDKISVPEEVISLIEYLRMSIEEQNKKTPETPLYVSDRRWKKIIQVLRTSAFLNGREKVDLMDCFLISHCIWEKPEQIDLVKEIISDTIRKHSYTINLKTDLIKNEIELLSKEVDQETAIKTMVNKKEPVPVEGNYYQITNYERSDDNV
jgi:MoxR-like ATPase